ncbi:DUF3857 domain-containing protein [Salegentibacter chungangensis]|uniref:DUF3857 domain-containing protein n=1 Tax=Salegentibacter chungangensis TaxID=1335724 RepID=A0ABW3NQW9_9FLAO
MRSIYLFVFILGFIGTGFAQDFEFGEVSKEEVLEKVHPKDKEANAAILYRKHKVSFEFNQSTGFTLVTDVHERIKIYNKEGYDWATKEILTYKDGSSKEDVAGLKAYTYNIKNGKLEDEKLRNREVFEEEVSKYRDKVKFTMPAVTDGSVIEYKYSIRSPFLVSIDDIALQEMIPINRLETKVMVPEYLGFKMHFNPKSPIFFDIKQDKDMFSYSFTTNNRTGGTGLKTVKNNFNRNKVEFLQNIYTISESDIPALKDEPYVDYLGNYAAYLKWELQYTRFPNSTVENYSLTWEDVAKSIYDDNGIENEIEKDNYFDKDIDKLLAGVTDPLQKAHLIYNFVKSKVKWNNYRGISPDNGAKSAYKDGEGSVADINLMLTAMLRYAGLNSSPVILSTQDNGIPIFPTKNGFNYIISSIELPEQIILLDATDEKASFGELPERARNWQGRVIRDSGSSAWVSLTPAYKSKNETILNVKMDDSLHLEGKSMNIFSGLYAKRYRDNYLDLNPEKYLEILEKDKGNIVISNIETSNAKEVGKDIKETYNFELENGMEIINDKVYLNPLFFTALEENPFKAEERNYPIFFDFPSVQGNTVNIMLPKGYAIESMPESAVIKFKDNAGIFKYIVSQNGNFLRIQTELDLNNIVYSSADYEFLKDFYSKIVEKHSEVIVLSKT